MKPFKIFALGLVLLGLLMFASGGSEVFVALPVGLLVVVFGGFLFFSRRGGR